MIQPGDKFSKLTVVERAVGEEKWKRRAFYNCSCECGKSVVVRGDSLVTGNTKSCGCHFLEKVSTAGGLSAKHESEYKIWLGIIDRCTNRNHAKFKDYGARGIIVSAEWLLSFEIFLKDIGERPSISHSVDRIDVNGNYSKENCRWALPHEQINNRRCTILIEINGVKTPLGELVKKHGLDYRTVFFRYKKGWSVDRLFSPAREKRRR